MALKLITSIALEPDPVRRKEEEQHARYAAGIAYAGKLVPSSTNSMHEIDV